MSNVCDGAFITFACTIRYDLIQYFTCAPKMNVSQLNLANETHIHTRTHTHPFNGPLSGTTRVSWYQKGKINLDFTEARDSEWQWHQLGHIQKSAPRSRQITMPCSNPPLR